MRLAALLCLGVLVLSGCSGPNEPIRIGAVYPLTGSEDEGGVDELRGVQLAAQLVNEDGGVGGRPIRIVPIDVPAADAAPGAIGSLLDQGIDLVLGSYGSTISAPAAQAAASRKMLFWETGAVGDMSDTGAGRFVFRVSPTGAVLGRSAISFVAEQLAPMLGRDATTLRFAVANVDDAYGRSVARGAVEELRDRGLQVVGTFPYDAYDLDAAGLVRRLRVLHPDVVFVSAYLHDGVAIRRQTVRQGLDLVASIGTSSSYCLPMFGERLGTDALGLFASDKPDAGLLNAGGLTPSARRLLTRASAAYEDQHEEEMEAPALSGFAAAWALFHDVLPRAATLDATGVGAAARGVRIPDGGLPNGSGLSFGAPGTADAGANLRAASVIWEWVRVGERAVVWPPSFATSEIRPIDIAP
ncbi:MAG TPA: ABC transporter substrate-binding protein [Actinomycetota bacterium]|nr:ABC transporter substrate-binding protein [Actinomycetota bacterium]